MLKKIIVILILLLNIGFAWSQADISMATHAYNRANYNPASIARTDYVYLFTNVRQQWSGVAGSPQTLNVQASGFNYKLKSAFGLSLVSDKIGIVTTINPMLTYAYRMSDNDNWSLAMGISAGVFNRYIDGSEFEAVDSSDPLLYNNINDLLAPDANLGLEFQSRNFIIGLSTTHLFSINTTVPTYLNTNHQYGYLIYKNTNLDFMNYYAGLQFVNRSSLSYLEANINLRFKQATGLTTGFKELFDVGFTYRTTKQITAILGINVNPNFKVGYAYDKSLITGYNQNGSHEIMLEYRIPILSAKCIPCMNDNAWYR